MTEHIVNGDSRSIFELVQGPGTRVRALHHYVARDVLANHELAKLLETADSANGWASLLPALFPEPGGTNAAAQPSDGSLAPDEKHAAADAFITVLNGTPDVVSSFESALADFLGLPHLVATSNGTEALIIALLAIGVGSGDEVILPANGAAAAENAVFACGATPVLADVTMPDGTLDPTAVEDQITIRTTAVLPVHLHGRLADMPGLRAVADRHGLRIVEDAGHALGVTGVGRFSEVAALSFAPEKNFGPGSQAGVVATGSAATAERCRALSNHGFADRSGLKSETFGLDCRISNAAAAVALALVPWLSLRALRRASLAKRYIDALRPLMDNGLLHVPAFVPEHSWQLFPVALNRPESRDSVVRLLRESCGVETSPRCPLLTHEQETPMRAELFNDVSLPRTESLHSRMLHLPLHNGISLRAQDRVTTSLHDILRTARPGS